ncbi:hypothetical protein FRC07_003434 [Ceratobasidium sp. 392]|nr:hypothetical protein FRC07_003434 [Ceratobasidium sp. 392]
MRYSRYRPLGLHSSSESGLATLSIPPENIIIDPSTPWLVIPRSLAMPFYVQTLGAAPQPATPSPRGATTPYLLPCSTPLILHLQLDGVNLTISTHDLVASAHAGTCISNLRTWVDPTEDSLVLGSIFMRSLHVAHPCYAVSEFYKRRMSMSRRGAVIGGTIGGVAGAALLAVGAYLLFRLARRGRGRNVQERGGIEFAEPRPRQPQPRSAKPSIASPPPPLPSVPYSPDTSIPLQPSTKTTEDEPPIAGPSSQPQLPSQRHLQRVEREVRTSSGSQFTEHFGDVAPEYVRTSRPRSPLGDKPLPHIPFHPPPPSAASGSSQVEQPAELSFVPFDTHAQQRKGTGSTSSSKRKDSTSPKNSLPPGAASPVESVGSYKPAEQSHSRGVSI